MSLTPAHIKKTCELKKHLHLSPPKQVLPIDLANLIAIIELPTLTSGFSHHM